MDDLLFSPITELAAAVRSRRLSPVELTRAYLDRIAKLDATLRAFITVDADGALAAARTLEREATAAPGAARSTACRSPTRISA